MRYTVVSFNFRACPYARFFRCLTRLSVHRTEEGEVMTEEVTQEETWLTQEAFDRLSKELEHLSGPGRAEIAEKIEAARDEGDLKENSGYHAARDEQGKQEEIGRASCRERV